MLWSLFLGINSAVYLSSNPKNNADVFLTPKNNAYFFNPKNNPQFEQPPQKKQFVQFQTQKSNTSIPVEFF